MNPYFSWQSDILSPDVPPSHVLHILFQSFFQFSRGSSFYLPPPFLDWSFFQIREMWYLLISSLTIEFYLYLWSSFSIASYLLDAFHSLGSGTIFTSLFYLFAVGCMFYLFALFQTLKGKNAWPQRRKSLKICHQNCSWKLPKETEGCSMARLCASVVLPTADNTSFSSYFI